MWTRRNVLKTFAAASGMVAMRATLYHCHNLEHEDCGMMRDVLFLNS